MRRMAMDRWIEAAEAQRVRRMAQQMAVQHPPQRRFLSLLLTTVRAIARLWIPQRRQDRAGETRSAAHGAAERGLSVVRGQGARSAPSARGGYDSMLAGVSRWSTPLDRPFRPAQGIDSSLDDHRERETAGGYPSFAILSATISTSCSGTPASNTTGKPHNLLVLAGSSPRGDGGT